MAKDTTAQRAAKWVADGYTPVAGHPTIMRGEKAHPFARTIELHELTRGYYAEIRVGRSDVALQLPHKLTNTPADTLAAFLGVVMAAYAEVMAARQEATDARD